MSNKLAVFYLTDVPFPDGGMAAGNRILHLSKALVSAGAIVHVLTTLSDSKRIEDVDIDGVHYHSLSNKCGWFGRNLARYFFFYIAAFRFIHRYRSKKMVVYCYGINAFGTLLAYIIAKICRAAFVREGCEYPYAIISGASRWNVFWQVAVLRLFDGVVAISKNLCEYYAAHTRKKCKVIHIPMTVDWKLFAKEDRASPFNFEYMAYMGNMCRKGGGVDVMVAAFNIVADKFHNLHLVLIGNGNDILKEQYEMMLDGEKRSRLHCLFGADIKRTEMPRYIKNAKLLAMLPLPTKQQEGCFPTKLGEYMSSGVPTVISRVGNPVGCLTDGENIVYAPPGDVDQTAEVLCRVLKNNDISKKVGHSAQKFAKEHFDYALYGEQLYAWYNQLLKR